MYKVIGADGKQYGPVSAELVRKWIEEGRANGQTQLLAEGGTAWQPLASFPEFADALAAKSPAFVSPPGASYSPTPTLSEQELLARDYDLDIGGCIGAGWRLLTGNFGLIAGGIAVVLIIQAGLSGLAQLPLIGIAFTVVSLVISGPMMGGAYYFLIKNIRRQPSDVGDIFYGFRSPFLHLFLGYIVMCVLLGLAMVPGMLIAALPFYRMVQAKAADPTHALIALAGLVVMVIPLIFLGVAWTFILPLIADRGMKFWPAMQLSRRMVCKHWWTVFGFMIVTGLLNILGVLCCCVGLFVTIPWIFSAQMYAYETIFSGRGPDSA